MDVAFVLVHSPSAGPLTWAPIAQRLGGAVVPDLTGVGAASPPFWPAVTATVAGAIGRLPAGQPVVLVAHGDAGPLLPAIIDASPRGVAGCVFVDAALPPGPDLPAPSGWDERPCGYLLFGPPYEPVAEDARQRGWMVDRIPGRHLHQLVDPGAVTHGILAMVRKWRP